MTKSEFEKIKADYEKETKEWEAYYIGQTVYDENVYCDVFEMTILKIDIDNRTLLVCDHSRKDIIKTMGYLYTSYDDYRLF